MAARLQRLRRGALAETFPLAGPSFRKAASWLFGGILLLGLVTRLHPAVRYGVWGSDSGEYLFLTRQLVETGRVLFPYDGWGLAYPYFPGMFVVSGATHAVLGVDLFHAVQWTLPVLAAGIPLLVGLLAYRITADPRAGVLAAAFVAITAPVVITTSHPMPGTLGQLLMLGMLALLPDAVRDRWNVVVLALLAVALVLTHHLTTYFAIGAIAMTTFYREMAQRSTDLRRLRVEAPVALALLGLAAVWWLSVATPFREEIVGDALPFPPVVTTLLFVGALAALPVLVGMKRVQSRWMHTPRYPSFARQRLVAMGIVAAFVGVIVFVMLVRLPGSNLNTSPVALLYILPVLGFLAFVPAGHAAIRFHRGGAIVLGFLYAVLASLVFALAIQSKVLFPFRHIDYMVMAMAPLAAVGMLMTYDQALAAREPAERGAARFWLAMGLGALLASGALLSLPPREVIGGFEEGIGHNEVAAVQWVAEHPELFPANTTFAADHRVSSLLFGMAGAHPTWDYTPVTYHADNVTAAVRELHSVLVPPRDGEARVDFVFLSPQIEAGVTLLQWENSLPMSEPAIAKFEGTPAFQKVYDVDGVRIYKVDWAFVADAGLLVDPPASPGVQEPVPPATKRL